MDFHIVMCFVLVGFVSVSESCSCITPHPQQVYCSTNPDIVAFEGKVQSVGTNRYNDHSYKVSISNVFKAPDSANLGNEIQVTTSSNRALCGVTGMKPGVTYFISGTLMDKEVRINLCNLIKEYEPLDEVVKSAFKTRKYDCKCPVCVYYHCNQGEPHCSLKGNYQDPEKMNKYCNYDKEKKACSWSMDSLF